jgi:hypothetical protein
MNKKKSAKEIKWERDQWLCNVDIVKIVAQAIRCNDYEAEPDDVEQKALSVKIYNRIKKTGIGDFESYIDSIIECPIFASYLAVNPSRQQPWQKRFFEFLEEEVKNDESRSLTTANSRKKSGDRLFLNNDGVVASVQRGDERDIDVILSLLKIRKRSSKVCKTIYISHKRIGGLVGSAQADQYKEVSTFLKYATKNTNPKEEFILAYEGEYFTPENVRLLEEFCKWDGVSMVEATNEESIRELIAD